MCQCATVVVFVVVVVVVVSFVFVVVLVCVFFPRFVCTSGGCATIVSGFQIGLSPHQVTLVAGNYFTALRTCVGPACPYMSRCRNHQCHHHQYRSQAYRCVFFSVSTAGSPSRAGGVVVNVFKTNKPSLPMHSFFKYFFYSVFVSLCLCGPFNCISFHKCSRQLPVFSLCSSGLISALLVLSTIYLFKKISLSHDINLCG